MKLIETEKICLEPWMTSWCLLSRSLRFFWIIISFLVFLDWSKEVWSRVGSVESFGWISWSLFEIIFPLDSLRNC